jgi:hypothetical protein
MTEVMVRLLLPVAGILTFFLLSLVTVRVARPKQPRTFFLVYGLLLLIAAAALYVRFWPLQTIDDGVGLAACLCVQALLCLTMWNTFYSVLWGFSGGLMCDLYTNEGLRRTGALVRSYELDSGLNRILSRRLPNLASSGYLDLQDGTLRLRTKGRVIAAGTLLAFKVFSLGVGGGVK